MWSPALHAWSPQQTNNTDLGIKSGMHSRAKGAHLVDQYCKKPEDEDPDQGAQLRVQQPRQCSPLRPMPAWQQSQHASKPWAKQGLQGKLLPAMLDLIVT